MFTWERTSNVQASIGGSKKRESHRYTGIIGNDKSPIKMRCLIFWPFHFSQEVFPLIEDRFRCFRNLANQRRFAIYPIYLPRYMIHMYVKNPNVCRISETINMFLTYSRKVMCLSVRKRITSPHLFGHKKIPVSKMPHASLWWAFWTSLDKMSFAESTSSFLRQVV